jgi:NDP-sugar pyrophosphorylase family protein
VPPWFLNKLPGLGDTVHTWRITKRRTIMEHVLGVGLAAGQGVRLRPLTLKAEGYIRSKATVRFLGERIVTWMLRTLHRHGLRHLLFITRGKENRGQVKSQLGYGEQLGMRIRYSAPELEGEDTGSAGAVFDNLTMCPPDVSALFVFPTDSLFECDLPAMLDFHQRHHAAVTIAAVALPAAAVAGQYGIIIGDAQGRVTGFREKPTLQEIYAHIDSLPIDHGRVQPVFTNAGCYLMDPRVLRKLADDPAIRQRPNRMFDIGGHFLPWLVKAGYPVYQFQIDRLGDLGNIPSYLQTMCEVLDGQFPSVSPLLPAHPALPGRAVIDATSWEMTDPLSDLSLQEKVARGLVTLQAPLRIGKYVRVEPGVTLASCNIDDECLIQRGATIVRSSIGESSVIGPLSHLQNVVTGMMVTIASTPEHPVTLSGETALGDAVVIHPGVTLSGRVTVFPRVSIPAGVRVTAPTEITSTTALLMAASRPAPAQPALFSWPSGNRLTREAVSSGQPV